MNVTAVILAIILIVLLLVMYLYIPWQSLGFESQNVGWPTPYFTGHYSVNDRNSYIDYNEPQRIHRITPIFDIRIL